MQLSSDSNSLSWPISSEALEFASQVSQSLHPSKIADRVFDNAIAVATVHNFLEILDISSSYQDSALCNSSSQRISDVSNLRIDNLGDLECRAISREEDRLCFPSEVPGDRIGYVFVSFDLEARQAVIHGFLPRLGTETIPVSALRSVEYLLQHLHSLVAPMLSITRWLSGVFETEWKPWDDLLKSTAVSSFRAVELSYLPQPAPTVERVQRAKNLDWQLRDQAQSMSSGIRPTPAVIAIEACQLAPLTIRVSVQVHPAQACVSLSALQLEILDEMSYPVMSAVARKIDNYMELQFKGVPGEVFQVQVTQCEYWAVEKFQL